MWFPLSTDSGHQPDRSGILARRRRPRPAEVRLESSPFAG
jgi:hypothetical protein